LIELIDGYPWVLPCGLEAGGWLGVLWLKGCSKGVSPNGGTAQLAGNKENDGRRPNEGIE
jgi:hypothetical protein